MPVNVDHLPRFFLNRDAVVDLCHPGGKYRKLSLRHPWFLARAQVRCNCFLAHSIFIKPPDLSGEIRRSEVSVEPFHMFHYLDEQSFRFNERFANDGERFEMVIKQIVGKRLTFEELTGKAEGSTTCS